jgi:hypothetical protein
MRRRFPLPNGFPFNPRRQAFEVRISQAHSLFDSGQFLESAQLFEELGAIAEARNGPRAPRFYMQAGRGYLHANQTSQGMALLEKGRQQFIQTGRSDVAARICFWLKDEVKSLGLIEQAEILTNWAGGISIPDSSFGNHPPLPLKCPSCGAPIRPNEINWLDSVTAECDFCGSPLRGISSS